MTLAITSPGDAETVLTTPILVKGTVDDPSVTRVGLGAELASGIILADYADVAASDDNFTITSGITGFSAADSSTPGWHRDCDGKAADVPSSAPSNAQNPSQDCAWHYAKVESGDSNFDLPGEAHYGELTLVETITVKKPSAETGEGGTTIKFDTWYNSETTVDYDVKQLQVDVVEAEGVTDTGWKTLVQIVGPWEKDNNPSAPSDAHTAFSNATGGAGYKYLKEMSSNFVETDWDTVNPETGVMCPPDCFPTFQTQWDTVFIDLAEIFAEDAQIKLRFKFDTKDSMANDQEGWYIDNVLVEGESAASASFATVTWNRDLNIGEFQKNVVIVEGENTVQFSAKLPYQIPDDSGELADVTSTVKRVIFLDTVVPQVKVEQNVLAAADAWDIITNSSTQQITGKFADMTADLVKINVETVAGTSTPYVNKNPQSEGTLDVTLSLVPGKNIAKVTVIDEAGREGFDTVRIYYDNKGPVVAPLGTIYPSGVTAARSGDPIIFQLNASDAGSGIQCAEVVFSTSTNLPQPCTADSYNSGAVEPFKKPAQIPDAVRESWGTTGEWLYPSIVPAGTPPGSLDITVRVIDLAGNSTVTTVPASVQANLVAINIPLMPGANLVSLPLIPDDRDSGNIGRLLEKVTSNYDNTTVKDVTDKIWYYDATQTQLAEYERWKVYSPSDVGVDTLDTMGTGKGYWWITKEDAFTMLPPLSGFTQQTPKVENFAYEGVFLRQGAEAPPVYEIEAGWNLIGLHSENLITGKNYLAALGRGDSAGWSSLLRYDNFVEFPIGTEGRPKYELGHFTRVFETDNLKPAQGFWLYSTVDGVITP